MVHEMTVKSNNTHASHASLSSYWLKVQQENTLYKLDNTVFFYKDEIHNFV